MKSPTSPLPRPVVFAPGARTSTGSADGSLPIPVLRVDLCAFGRGRPRFTDARKGIRSAYVLSVLGPVHRRWCERAVSRCATDVNTPDRLGPARFGALA